MTEAFWSGELVSPDTVLRRVDRPHVEHVEIDGETVVFDCRTSALHLLDAVATRIWGAVDGSASLQSISEDLARAFEHPVADTLLDVQKFAADLSRLALVELESALDD